VHVDLLIKRAIEEYSFDINLSQLPVINGSDCKESADGLPTCSGCKGESEILARDLDESFGDKPGFEASDLEILVMLDMENLFITNGLPPWWQIFNFFIDALCLSHASYIAVSYSVQ
jgi:hypothetical protein